VTQHSSAGQRSPEFSGVAVTVAVIQATVDGQEAESYSKLEASAGFEPAVEVLQVGLNGSLESALVRAVFRIASRYPPKSAVNCLAMRALPSPLPSSLVVDRTAR